MTECHPHEHTTVWLPSKMEPVSIPGGGHHEFLSLVADLWTVGGFWERESPYSLTLWSDVHQTTVQELTLYALSFLTAQIGLWVTKLTRRHIVSRGGDTSQVEQGRGGLGKGRARVGTNRTRIHWMYVWNSQWTNKNVFQALHYQFLWQRLYYFSNCCNKACLKNSFGKEGFISAHSLRGPSIIQGRQDGLSVRQLVTPHPQSRRKE